MQSTDIIQKPTANETYAKNTVPVIIISTSEIITASLKLTGGINNIFVGKYCPDFSNRVNIDFATLYESILNTVMPPTGANIITQDDYRKSLTITLQGTTGAEVSIVFYVANTKLKSYSAFSTWCRTHFLTNQPIEKVINYESPEWLTYLNLEGRLSLVARFYTKSGGHVDELVESHTQNGCYTVNVKYSRLIGKLNVLPGSLLSYYDLILINDSNTELAVQRYIYREYTGLEKYFCFVNQLGGIDTLICQGANTLQPEITHNIGRFGSQYLPIDDTDDVRVWGQNTGMMPYRQRDWVFELLSAKKDACKYEPSDNSFNAIAIKSSDISMGDDEQLASCSFTYIYRDESGGVNTQGQHAVLHNSAIVKQEEMEDLTQSVEMELEDDETQAVTVNATKIFVEYTTRDATSSRQEPIYYYIGDATEPSGSFIPGEQEYVVIEIEEGQTIRFSTENSDIEKITVRYYEE